MGKCSPIDDLGGGERLPICETEVGEQLDSLVAIRAVEVTADQFRAPPAPLLVHLASLHPETGCLEQAKPFLALENG